MKILDRIVSLVDIFGKGVNLNIGRESVVSSKIGFIFTLITAGVSLAFGFSRF